MTEQPRDFCSGVSNVRVTERNGESIGSAAWLKTTKRSEDSALVNFRRKVARQRYLDRGGARCRVDAASRGPGPGARYAETDRERRRGWKERERGGRGFRARKTQSGQQGAENGTVTERDGVTEGREGGPGALEWDIYPSFRGRGGVYTRCPWKRASAVRQRTLRPFDAFRPLSLSLSPSHPPGRSSRVFLFVAPFDPVCQPPWPPFLGNTTTKHPIGRVRSLRVTRASLALPFSSPARSLSLSLSLSFTAWSCERVRFVLELFEL